MPQHPSISPHPTSSIAANEFTARQMSSQPWSRGGKCKAGPSISGSPQPPSREQTEGWRRTRERVSQALAKIFPRAQLVSHNVLEVGTEDMESSPVNRQACLRFTERSANILLAVLQEAQEAGEDILNLLSEPSKIFLEHVSLCLLLKRIEEFLSRMAHRSFLKRYLTRAETLREIERCNDLLKDALLVFSLSLQIRYLKQTHSIIEPRRDDEELLQMLLLLGVDGPGALSKLLHASPLSVEEKAEDIFFTPGDSTKLYGRRTVHVAAAWHANVGENISNLSSRTLRRNETLIVTVLHGTPFGASLSPVPRAGLSGREACHKFVKTGDVLPVDYLYQF
ncbi:hypothetical protein B0H14DRAFT_3164343 [Mycena olivaceomarginata]|nr:hypothetical protein B0H14DRAFT_3164343 [Mycena olivaceomarginata]